MSSALKDCVSSAGGSNDCHGQVGSVVHSANTQNSSRNFARCQDPALVFNLSFFCGFFNVVVRKGQKLESLPFYAPPSKYTAIFVIYFTYYIYVDAACEHLKCKTVIYVFSTAGSEKWRMWHMLSNPGSQSPPSKSLLCADEVVANASGLKRVKVRFTPTGPNQYPAKTIDLNGCSAYWDLRGIGVDRLSLILTAQSDPGVCSDLYNRSPQLLFCSLLKE